MLWTGHSWQKETLKTGGRCAILYGMYINQKPAYLPAFRRHRDRQKKGKMEEKK